MTIQVLGVGLPRTGTQSLADALEILGYRTLHEAFRHIDGPMFDCDSGTCLWEYPGYDALIEAHYWRLYHLAFPAAKVILTIRDIEAWYRSIESHVDAIHTRRDTTNYESIERADRVHERLFGSRWPLETLWSERFIQHRLLVEAVCGGSNLLVCDVTQDGWGPLCEFLGKTIPDQPFPWRNRLETKATGS